MERERIQLLAQINKAMVDAAIQLEEAIKNRDSNKAAQLKEFIISNQKKFDLSLQSSDSGEKMSIEALNANLSQQRKLLENLLILNEELKNSSSMEESSFFTGAIDSVFSQISIINASIPQTMADIITPQVSYKPLPKEAVLRPIPTSSGLVLLNKNDRQKYIEELKIEEDVLRKIKRTKRTKQEVKFERYKKPSEYISIASRMFSKSAYQFAKSDLYRTLNSNLKKANMYYLPSTYVSVTILTVAILFVISVLIAIFSSFFGLSMVIGTPYPLLKVLDSNGVGMRLVKNIGIAILIPIVIFFLALMYPSSQASSISKRIENELPFAIIHMSSIAGSGVEPKKIFEILALSPEYPTVSAEIRKIINQVNLYGYDLVTALRNVGKATSSEKLSALLNGISTNIVSGGELSVYLDKKAADSLLEYKLERKKYATVAETSMDIYIGILVAAPLILMVLLVLMNVTGMGFGLSMDVLSMLIIGGIAVLNVGFLMFLQLQQPG